MPLNDFDIAQKVTAILAGTRPFSSRLQLARQVRLSDDTLNRAIERVEAYLRTPLIAVSENHRLTLTSAGRTFMRLAGQLSSLADQEDVPAETITVQADPDVAAAILPAALPPFLEVWGGLVQLRVGPLDGSTRKSVSDGLTSFAIDLAEDGETVPAAEALGPRLPWVLLVPKTHALSELQGTVSSEQVRKQGRFFLSSMAAANPSVSAFLAGVPAANRLEIQEVRDLVAADLGVGIALDLHGNQNDARLTKLALEKTEPAQLRFVLPRRGASVLSEPKQSLVDAIRKAVEARFAAPPTPELPPASSANGSPGEHLFTSVEATNP